MSELIMWLWIGLMGLGIILVLIRLFMGPGKFNRIMALDTITTITTSLIMIIAIIMKEGLFLDVAIVYALLAFTSVIGVAKLCSGEEKK